MPRELYEIGEVPPLGEVPPKMHAQVIRPERFGEPELAIHPEVIDTPVDLEPNEALVMVMAAGINYNNVWAAKGEPVDVIAARQKQGEKESFHIGGSDASGIVYKIGDEVEGLAVGDEVVVHCGQWDENDTGVRSGADPMFSPSFRIWGYESNWGSFAQFTKVQAHQCMPKAENLTWEEAAAPTLVGATAYRMLHGWKPHTIEKGDVALIWGGAGGLGSMAIQIVNEAGGKAIAVVSNEEGSNFCKNLGAEATINRRDFDHWGIPPRTDSPEYSEWLAKAKLFGEAIWEAAGERVNPKIVFEHPGQDTIPTSSFVCDAGGMVVICAGTTGFTATEDLRPFWMKQKRLQGSHFANNEQANAFNELILTSKIDPCLGETFSFEDIPVAHQRMMEGTRPLGVMSALVNAPEAGIVDY
ncbi:MAG TPA: crotonyl-CoA carboxylase/reductase [Candidatus Saccharimonadales bacterium]|nr:crotonyl-CoA carboxylase/reductase [Candidatus Saccharimonadales bacterium]